jgi:hypothetical protein
MTVHYSSRGKYFTDVVRTSQLPVTIETPGGRIRGNLHLRPENRLIDELNDSPPFLAVTEARILTQDGDTETDFLSLNKNQILWVLPEEASLGEASDERR